VSYTTNQVSIPGWQSPIDDAPAAKFFRALTHPGDAVALQFSSGDVKAASSMPAIFARLSFACLANGKMNSTVVPFPT